MKAYFAAVAAVLLGSSADAAVYSFNYSNTNARVEQAMGMFETNASNSVTSISGSVTYIAGTFAITGLSSYASASNVFSPTQPYFSFQGLSFTASNGTNFNLYSNNSMYGVADSSYDATGGGNVNNDAVVSLAVNAVPEPATWAMMMLGFGAMGYAMRRKNKVATRICFA